MDVSCVVYSHDNDRLLTVSSTGKYHIVRISVMEQNSGDHEIEVDGDCLIKAITNAMNT